MKTLALLLCLAASATAAYNVYWYDQENTLPDRNLMVHLFEWKWTDIANECENFLQYYGYGAVQVSPPMEHIDIVQNNNKPWWIRYQPVSYQLTSRSGNEAEFKDMVERCNKVGVRIIVDGVLNHMVGMNQKKGVSGVGSSGSSEFDGTHGVENFPGVPYTSKDFNDFRCDRDIAGSDYQNSAQNVKNCRLVALLDLNQGSAYVQSKMVEYLDKLLCYGVAGFRLDASKHMWPADLGAILNATNDVRADIFGANVRPFVVHEVIDRGGEAVKCTDYLNIGRYTNFNFGADVSSAIKNGQYNLLPKVAPGYNYGNMEDHDVLNFIDNHDNQRDSNPYVLTYKDGDKYKMAVSFMLAWTYGYPRVMSSYYFTYSDQGPPNSGAGSNYATKGPTFNQDLTCDSNSGWVCEHRWPEIREMAKFRQATSGTAVTQVVTPDSQRIAFARVGKGFFALNSGAQYGKFFQTTMQPGTYCDHYSGGIANGKCVGTTITVSDDGTAYITIPQNKIVAISVASKLNAPAPPTPSIPSNWQRTVVFLKPQKNIDGQNLFIRGGIPNAKNCATGPYMQTKDPCAFKIVHNTTVPFVYDEYLSWSQSDNYMDFEGAEANQGTHDGLVAAGTPLAYSTNDPSAVEFQPLNQYGENYWVVQFYMDCSQIESGWFELKGYVNPGGWENNISQQKCVGSIGGTAPVSGINHLAKCGAINVFQWNSSWCQIDSF